MRTVAMLCGAVAAIAMVADSMPAVGEVGEMRAPPRWAPSVSFPVAVAPVDWSVPRGYRGVLVRRRPRGFPAKLIALTFDDGPDGKVTPRIIESLAAHRARATFFVLGERVARRAGLLRQMASRGHAIGNHSFSHPAKPSAEEAERELQETEELIRQAAGRPPTCFRPPYGITENELTPLALERGYAAVLWTVLSADDHGLDADAIVANVVHSPRPGDIILMHDGPGHQATARAVPQILDRLTEAGFQFVTIPELLQAWDEWLRQSKRAGPPARAPAGKRRG